MRLDLSAEQVALRDQLRAYFAAMLPDEVRFALGAPGEGGELYRELIRKMGADGWLGIGWPVEYGGQDRPATDQFIFYDEAQRAGAPMPMVTLNTVGPMLMRYGSDEQKAYFLPRILAGDVMVAIGYSEAEAGTDLAALRTRAVRDGDQYVINGSKVFTSAAHEAEWIWLAVRTDLDAPKHKGISIVLVPTETPGVSVTPIHTVGGMRTNATYYEDVRVPITNLVGEENGGWSMITGQLNHERVALAAWGGLAHRLWTDTRDFARSTGSLANEWVRLDLAKTYAQLSAMSLLNWRMACAVAAGTLTPADASSVKVFGTEAVVDVYKTLLGIVGAGGYIR
ncbi:MAG: acyl-CoA dehydrogenase family protein, partial [Actinobacteria bacterium]|nr:acyl-CoA dehydrogenase family protein [Actinomycetota bacterium]